jgi:ABC-type branched-subunit amino acid transport system permease subunit
MIRPLIPVAVVAGLPALPFVNNYIQAATVRALIFIALGQAWNIVAGIGGQLSLGHGVFLGLGCYVTGILFNEVGIPPWLGVWAGALVSLLVALIMGSMTLRMRGVFFALATVAVSLAFDQLARHYVDLTGGDNGLALRFTATRCGRCNRARRGRSSMPASASSSSTTGSPGAFWRAASDWRCAPCVTMRWRPQPPAFTYSAPSCWGSWSAPR